MAGPVRGFINIDKPQGMTSFDVVRRIRRAAATKRVGHAGTLDPNATGVLPVALGEATRLIDELVGTPKRYRAEVVLGRATDTYDGQGQPTAEHDASAVTRAAVEAALAPFHGQIMQAPPAFSAVKRDGVPAYRAARRGQPLELAPRPVMIYGIELLGFAHPAPGVARATLDVRCGRGFYVRSLAHELGLALGVGGYLAELRRTQVGPFQIEAATPLDRAVALLEAGRSERLVHAPDVVLTRWPALILGGPQVARVRRGMEVVALPRPGYVRPPEARRARCYGPAGELVALVEPGLAIGTWHPFRVFPPDTISR